MHLNLASQQTLRPLAAATLLPPAVRELLTSAEESPRALVADGYVACVLQDLERNFDGTDTGRVAALRFALGAQLIITGRHHPLAGPDIARERLRKGERFDGAPVALDILGGAIAEVIGRVLRDMTAAVQAAEDELVDENRTPNPRALAGARRRTVQLLRQLAGLRDVFRRLEEDEALPPALKPVVAKLVQRFESLDNDVAALQGQVRSLAQEMDLQAAQRTNQNLYILSILTALMLPATLVTGFFGMNTGGMPFSQSGAGSFLAGLLVAGSAAGVYLLLRSMGFFRR